MFAQPQMNCAAKFLWDRQNAEKISLWQLADMSVLAAMEVAGRHVVSRLPGLRAHVTKWVRRPPAQTARIELDELEAKLVELGVARGRDLLVHSSWMGLGPIRAKPRDVLSMLRGLIGDQATLLMPSHPQPFTQRGLAVYDVRKSFSTAGLLTETLRRTPGALRSPFPIASVCAFGPAAPIYTRDFREESGGTPYGRGSPYWQLGQNGGQVLVMGIDFIRPFSLNHVAFDVLGEANPVRDYHQLETFLVVRDEWEEQWTIRRPRSDLEVFYASIAFRKMVMRAGLVRLTQHAGVALALANAREFLDWHLPLARKSGWPYWGFPRAR